MAHIWEQKFCTFILSQLQKTNLKVYNNVYIQIKSDVTLESVASLGLVSPGRQLMDVTLFFGKKSDAPQ